MRLFVLFIALCAPISNVFADELTPPPGEYLAPRGAGRLTIGTNQTFSIFALGIKALGVNGHMCELVGQVVDEKGMPDDDDSNKPCIVTFAPRGPNVEVLVNDTENCHRYCGMRAHFVGLYLKPPPGCGTDEMTERREIFKQAYERRQFTKAVQVLQPGLENCGRLLGEVDEGWVRNDLAITYYKLGEARKCLATLSPLAEYAKKTESEIRLQHSPADAESLIPIARALRTNTRLCQRLLFKAAK